MVLYYPSIQIPLLCFGVVLWILCCHFVKKRREAEDWPLRIANSPSVYVIPIYGEERVDEEVAAIYEAYFQHLYRDPLSHCLRNITPPPPYRFEAPSYPDPPPSYTDPPAYSQQR